MHWWYTVTGAGEEVIAVLNVIKPVVTISQEDEIVDIKVQSGIGIEETFALNLTDNNI